MRGLGNSRKQNATFVAAGLLLSLSLSGCGWNPFAANNNGPEASPIQAEEPEDETPQKEVSIFFNHGAPGELANVTRSLPEEFRRQPIRFAMGELLKGPRSEEKKQGFYTEIPAGTELLGVNRHGSNLTVDMSQKFTVGGGSTSMTQRVEEIKRTVYALDKHHQLHVSIEGKPLEILGGEGLEVNDSLKRQVQ